MYNPRGHSNPITLRSENPTQKRAQEFQHTLGRGLAALALIALFTTSIFAGSRESVLYDFKGDPDGAGPPASLVQLYRRPRRSLSKGTSTYG
jgi:hypothetical protein